MKDSINLLYITYIDFGKNRSSGSTMRPQKMFEAFKGLKINVKTLECQQNKVAERRKKVKEVLKWIDSNYVDICYIESPSGPIFSNMDLKLIKKVKSKGIPIGYFWRDAFWLFEEKMSGINIVKRNVIKYLNVRAMKCIKNNSDVVYVPSQSVMDLFEFAQFKKMDILPPAADNVKESEKNDVDIEDKTTIYVGAVSEIDGTFDLIKAFSLLNEKEHYKLILVCRENEWLQIKEVIGTAVEKMHWLDVRHTSGQELDLLYDKASLAIIPRKPNEYIDGSIPVKLFEYIGHGKPVISTPRKETMRIIEEGKCGIICEDSINDMANCIKQYFGNIAYQRELKNNVAEIAKKHTWISRADKVVNDLLRCRES